MGQTDLLRRTRRELSKQVGLTLGLFVLGGGWYVLSVSFQLWLTILAVIVILGALLIFASRRGFWVCAWRAASLFFCFGLMGGSALLLFGRDLISDKVLLAVATTAVAGGAILYFVYWIRPYWRDAYDLNRARKKFDLEKGTYSVVISWAVRAGSSRTASGWIPCVVAAGPGLYVFLKSRNDWELAVLSVLSLFLLWVAVSMAMIEAYNAYKIWRMERKIGGPLIIDAYVHGGR